MINNSFCNFYEKLNKNFYNKDGYDSKIFIEYYKNGNCSISNTTISSYDFNPSLNLIYT